MELIKYDIYTIIIYKTQIKVHNGYKLIVWFKYPSNYTKKLYIDTCIKNSTYTKYDIQKFNKKKNYENNKKNIIEYQKEYYQNNKEKSSLYGKEYRKKNKEKIYKLNKYYKSSEYKKQRGIKYLSTLGIIIEK